VRRAGETSLLLHFVFITGTHECSVWKSWCELHQLNEQLGSKKFINLPTPKMLLSDPNSKQSLASELEHAFEHSTQEICDFLQLPKPTAILLTADGLKIFLRYLALKSRKRTIAEYSSLWERIEYIGVAVFGT